MKKVASAVVDATVEAYFFNPHSTSLGQWSYGFWVRGTGPNAAVVVLRSDRTIHVFERLGNEYSELYGPFALPAETVDTSSGGGNSLQVAMVGNQMWSIVNGFTAGNVVFKSGMEKSGDVYVVNGYYRSDVVDQSLRFVNVAVYAAQVGFSARQSLFVEPIPTSFVPRDDIPPKEANRVSLGAALGNAQNFVVQATFYNPYGTSVGDWDYGFVFMRNAPDRDAVFVTITSRGIWSAHTYQAPAPPDEVVRPDSGVIDVSESGSNLIQLAVSDSVGWLWVNRVYVGSFPLAFLADRDSLRPISGRYVGGARGYVVHVQNLTLWSGQAGTVVVRM
ncbi:MAG: hypothetical protein HY673_19860 [Chloroflexi bacterium]|nr:hypothetical protein [Chloroflexota bacterium]